MTSEVLTSFDVEATGPNCGVHKIQGIGFATAEHYIAEHRAVIHPTDLVAFNTKPKDFEKETRVDYWERPEIAPTLTLMRAQPVQHSGKSGARHVLKYLAELQAKHGNFELCCDNPAFDAKWTDSLIDRALGEPGIEYRRALDGKTILKKNGRQMYCSIKDIKSVAAGILIGRGEVPNMKLLKKKWWENSKKVSTLFDVPHDHNPANDALNMLLNYLYTLHGDALKVEFK